MALLSVPGGWRLRVRFKMKRETGCTHCKFSVGLGWFVNGSSSAGTSDGDVWVDATQYAENVWQDIELFFVVVASSITEPVYYGVRFRQESGAAVGARVYISDVQCDEVLGLGNGMPQNAQSSGYTLAIADSGKHVYISTGGVTVPANSTVPLPIEFAVDIVNNSGSNQTITQAGGVTLYLAGTATTGNRTLAQRGRARLLKVATDTWIIDGTGVT